jgi:hypothetical protein
MEGYEKSTTVTYRVWCETFPKKEREFQSQRTAET